MKKYFFISAIALFFTILNSCSDESDSMEFEDSSNAKFQKVDQIVIDYYKNDFVIGRSISIENQNIKLTSLNNEYQKSPIGYIITDLSTNELLTFIDINFNENKVTVIDKIKNVTAISDTFFKENNINPKNGFDFISLIENFDNNQIQEKFWGWECTGGSCSTCIECCYYVLGIKTVCSEVDFDFHQP